MTNSEVLKKAVAILESHGTHVIMDSGWQGREASRTPLVPEVCYVHHTGDVSTPLRVIRSGRSNLPGPLANILVGQSGNIYVMADGYTNDVGYGGYDNWRLAKEGKLTSEVKPPASDGSWSGNRHGWGIEADGTGKWTPIVRKHVVEVCAALHIAEGWTNGARVIAHKELTRRKPGDPGDDMGSVRADVLAKIAEWSEPTPDPTPTPATVLALRVATFNTMDPALTGSKPLTASRAAALGKTAVKAKADVYLLNECPEVIRDPLRAAMPGGASRWLVRPRGAQAIMWDSDRLTETAETEVNFKGISYQGGQICVLKDKSTGQQVVFGSYHLTPNSRSTDAQQRSQMSQMIAAIRKFGQGPRILGGDGVNDNAWLPGWDDAREKAANSGTRDAKTYQGKAITDRIHSDSLTPVDWRGYNVKPSSGSDHALVITAVNIPIQCV